MTGTVLHLMAVLYVLYGRTWDLSVLVMILLFWVLVFFCFQLFLWYCNIALSAFCAL